MGGPTGDRCTSSSPTRQPLLLSEGGTGPPGGLTHTAAAPASPENARSDTRSDARWVALCGHPGQAQPPP